MALDDRITSLVVLLLYLVCKMYAINRIIKAKGNFELGKVFLII